MKKHLHIFALWAFVALAVLATPAHTTHAQQLNERWSPSNGPYGGIINHLSNGSTGVFAGTSTTGIFRLNSVGRWEQMNNGLANINIDALYALPDANSVYAATNDQSLYGYNGINWVRLSSIPGRRAKAIVVANDIVYVGNDFGVYRSTDGGRTFPSFPSVEGIGNVDRSVNALVASGSTIIAATKAGLYRSTNTALNWSLIVLPGVADSLSSVEHIWASGSTVIASTLRGPYLSRNFGITWEKIGTVSFDTRRAIQMGSTFLAIDVNKNVLRLNTTGNAWDTVTAINQSPAVQNTLVRGATKTLEARGSVLYTGGDAGVYRSTNGGYNWESSNSGLIAHQINAVFVNSAVRLAGSDIGVFIYDSLANQWRETRGLNGLGVSELAAASNALFAGTIRGVYRSLDNGNTWFPPAVPEANLSNDQVASFAYDGDYVYAGTMSRGFYRSPDLGSTWRQVGALFNAVRAIVPLGDKLFATHGNDILVSTEKGRNWIPSFPGVESTPVTSMVARMGILYATRQQGSEGKAADAGVFRSADSGKTWQRFVSAGLTSLRLTKIATLGSMLIVGTDNAGVFFSPDSIAAWRPLNTGLADNSILDFAWDGNYRNASRGVFGKVLVGTSSAGVYEIDWLTGIRQQPESREPLEGAVYPNPTGDRVTLEARVQPNALATIRLLTLMGTVAQSLQERASGSQLRATLDVTALPAGTYIVEILDGEHRFSTRIVKQ